MRGTLKDTRLFWFCQGSAGSVSVLEFNSFKVLGSGTVVVSNSLTGSTMEVLLFKGNCQSPRLSLEDGRVMTVPQNYLRDKHQLKG